MISTSLYSSNKDDWSTPRWLAEILVKEFEILIDVCADADNTIVPSFWTKEYDAMSFGWGRGIFFMNPPYGRDVGTWIAKAHYESEFSGSVVVCLLPARTDTLAWHEIIFPYASEIRFIKGRLKFGNSLSGAPFPSAVVVFGLNCKQRILSWTPKYSTTEPLPGS